MGQYHVPVCIEAEEGLDPHRLGCGLKEGEQGFTRPGTPNAIVALICARGGNMPADCSQSPVIGKWAGKRVLVQGDYAEDEDILNWDGPPLSTLYSATTPVEDRRPKSDWSTTPVFADITPEVRGFLEAACNVRYFDRTENILDGTARKIVDTYTTTEWVRVRPKARHYGGCGVAEYVIADGYTERDLEWLKGRGMTPLDIQRVPRSGDWHGLLPEEVSEGQRRVIVNLDTFEYLDPARFGQVPTLAGMVTAAPKDRDIANLKKAQPENLYLVDIAGALFCLLCHPQRRGGGDIPANADEMAAIGDPARKEAARLLKGLDGFKGRWRGDRILGTSEIRHEDWPTTNEVLERGTDISEMALRYLAAVSHY